MPEKKDYFENIQAVDPGKRHMGRLENNRILKAISKKRRGYELNWTSGKVSFMKSYETKVYPRSFASPNEKVFIQVSIRLITGSTSQGAPVSGLKGLEVYYRFLKTVAVIEKKKDKDDIEESEKTEESEFSTGKNIVKTTGWQGSSLYSSQTAKLFYDLLESIGIDKVKGIMERITKKEK
jgi:hypothetical protein